MNTDAFRAASEAIESAANNVTFARTQMQLAETERGSAKTAYRLLLEAASWVEEYRSVVESMIEDLAPVSDSAIPHHSPTGRVCYSSAHEAMLDIGWMFPLKRPEDLEDLDEYSCRELLDGAEIWTVLSADLRARILRERGKLLAKESQGEDRSTKEAKSKPGRKSNSAQDAKIVKEYYEGLETGRWNNGAEFARKKKKTPAWFSQVKKRVESSGKG